MATNKTVLTPSLKDRPITRSQIVTRASFRAAETAKQQASSFQPIISTGNKIPVQWRAVRTGVMMENDDESKEKDFSTFHTLTEENSELPQWTPVNTRGGEQEINDESEDEDTSTHSSDTNEHVDLPQRSTNNSKGSTLAPSRHRNKQFVSEKEIAVPSRKRKRDVEDEISREPSLLTQWFEDETKIKKVKC